MYTIRKILEEREKNNQPIRVAIIGMGFMGKSLVSQITSMKGMEVSLITSRRLESCEAAIDLAKIPLEACVHVEDARDLREKWRIGTLAYGTGVDLLWSLEEIDCVVDCTGHPDTGAYVAYESIKHRKHVVSLNVEMDAVVGPYLSALAKENGVVYTGTAGDEPGSAMELYDFAKTLGFDVLAMGKGKNNPIDYEATPVSVAEEARQKGLAPEMLCSFIDGTKTMVELCAMANATGFLPDIIGGHGPEATPDTLAETFSPREDGGILHRDYVVDYVRGVAPGVFVIINHENPIITDEMRFLKLGEGPRFALYRPYHLTSIETPISIARAVEFASETIAPMGLNPVCSVPAVAKRDLEVGEVFDGIGEYMCLGSLTSWEDQMERNLVPIGLLDEHLQLRRPVAKGEFITWADVEILKTSYILKLYLEMLEVLKEGR